MEVVRKMSSLQKGYVASCLLTEIIYLQDLLGMMEAFEKCDPVHIRSLLRRSESNLRSLCKSLGNYN